MELMLREIVSLPVLRRTSFQETSSVGKYDFALYPVKPPMFRRKDSNIRITRHPTRHPADKYREESTCERRRASSRAHRLQLLLRAQAKRLSLSASLGYTEQALKYQTQHRESNANIEVLSVYLCVLGRSLSPRRAWPIELLQKLGSRSPCCILGPSAGPRCAIICSRVRGCCFDRHSLKTTIYRFVGVCCGQPE